MITSRRYGAFILLSFLTVLLASPEPLFAQGLTKWIQIGSMHNWYSEKGWEIEEGNVLSQQYGLRWPAQYQYQDMQAAKGLWIGTTNYTDDRGINYPFKVVHVGPRVNGDFEFYPLQFDLYAKFERPRVFVDGDPSFAALEELTAVTDTLKADRMMLTVANTAVGLTMTRRIYAFSQQYHDNYHIFDITFTNTGNTDGDAAIETPGKTLTGVYFYWQFRYSVCREVRYMVNNSSGWGINTMNDARGPWYPDAPTDIRAQFSWHGYHSEASKPPGTFDNIGAPIWNPGLSSGFIPSTDTTWRLGAAQFVGNVHLHADTSPSNAADDPNQPSTTGYIASDEPATRNNSQFNSATMSDEYQRLMSAGHAVRHAWLVMPGGNFSQQNVMANIGAGAPGGWSSTIGYGPYTIGPGESIRIVFAEGANGLTREEAIRIGRQFKSGTITNEAKNDSVFLGRDRIFETFRRAVANYGAGYDIPQPPYPPQAFNVTGGGNKIAITWQPNPLETANGFVGYKLYRATGRSDSTFHLLFQSGGTAPTDPSVQYSSSVAYTFDDVTAIRGIDYYYYITAFGDPSANSGAAMTPAGSLESSRFYTQTYTAANLKRPPGRPVEYGRDALNVASVLINGTNTVEFEFADNVGGKSDGFSVTQFYMIVTKRLLSNSSVVSVDSIAIPAAQLPLNFYQTAVGTRLSRSMTVAVPTDTTAFYTAYYQVKAVDVFSPGMAKMYLNGTEVPLPAGIISPYKTRMEAIRIAPNPYIISSAENVLRFPDQPDRIAFFNVPGNCKIKIYTELGELIKEIDHTNGTGDEYWNSITSSNQVVVSGVYIVVFEDKDTGDRIIKKLVIIR